jgi:hypothetical protein
MDNNYLERVTARRRIMTEHTSAVCGTVPSGDAPVKELYSYLLGTYLPARYPTMFNLTQPETTTHGSSQTLFRNKVTGQAYPLSPPPAHSTEMLKILGETVEDDLFLLLQDKDSGEHRAVAFVCCHPAGFDPSDKLGKKLAEIHGPVPAYEKIGASMERYFARLEVGRSVKRTNVRSLFLFLFSTSSFISPFPTVFSIQYNNSQCLSLFPDDDNGLYTLD